MRCGVSAHWSWASAPAKTTGEEGVNTYDNVTASCDASAVVISGTSGS
eukprot:COSAG06_NODE_30473_length_538_cov_1.107062_2_plen_47_part_01